MTTITQRITRIIVDELDCDFEDVTPTTALRDLGADDVNITAIHFAIEDEWPPLTIAENEGLTVGELVDLVERATQEETV